MEPVSLVCHHAQYPNSDIAFSADSHGTNEPSECPYLSARNSVDVVRFAHPHIDPSPGHPPPPWRTSSQQPKVGHFEHW